MKETSVQALKGPRTDFLTKFYAEQAIPAESLNRFASIPWTNRWLLDPAYKTVPTFSRHLKSNTGEDFFFSRTINSPETIPHMISLVRKNQQTPKQGSGFSHLRSGNGSLSKIADLGQADLILLIELGKHGLNGHPSIVHGGISAALLDEAMGTAVMIHSFQPPESNGGSFTANLNINFRAPVYSPGQYMVKCWILGRERRKWITRGAIIDQNDRVLVEAEAIWVTSKAPRPRL